MTIDDKIRDEKLQYDINRKAAKICDTCLCRLCKKFQPNLGFINQKYDFKKM